LLPVGGGEGNSVVVMNFWTLNFELSHNFTHYTIKIKIHYVIDTINK
jgi:hypothetical protein